MTKMDTKPMSNRNLEDLRSTECSLTICGYRVHTKLTLEAIDFIWTYLVGRTRENWLVVCHNAILQDWGGYPVERPTAS